MNSAKGKSKAEPSRQSSAGWIVSVTCLVALLHFGRQVLEPIALAGILSLAIAPMVRRVRLLGLGQTGATLVSVVLLGACAIGTSVVVVMQIGAVASDLPRYSASIHSKIVEVQEMTARPFAKWETNLRQIAPVASSAPTADTSAKAPQTSSGGLPMTGMAPNEALSRLFAALWGPMGEFAIVLVLLLFILQEHEALRDKLIRVVGEADVAKTLKALSDAGEGVSRFIFLQFAVNVAFAAVIGASLWLIGVPHAVLWGTFGGLLRFVPYVGVPIAGLATSVFAAAVDPGWTLLLSCLAVFVVVELLLANAIEPHVYGHSTGLAPLTVIVSALFWGTLWGPVGLLLSTPLTVCLVVIGRHVRSLTQFTTLLGDAPGLGKGLRFYQRALSAEYADIVNEAKEYLRKNSLASYCDHILLPGLAFAADDFTTGRIDQEQQARIRSTIVRVIESEETRGVLWQLKRRPRKVSLADANVGTHLRSMRESRAVGIGGEGAKMQSVVLCTGVASERSELLCELMVRSLTAEGVAARGMPAEQLPEDFTISTSQHVDLAFVTYPLEDEIADWRESCRMLRSQFADLIIATVRLPPDDVDETVLQDDVDLILHSFSEAVVFAADAQRRKGKGADRGAT